MQKRVLNVIVIFPFLGGLGQLGTGLAKLLRKEYGTENIILSDIIRPSKEVLEDGKIVFNDKLSMKCEKVARKAKNAFAYILPISPI